MVNRINNPHDLEANPNSTHERSFVSQNTRSNPGLSDEVIVSLANKYENKRARQVTEWERVQPANIRGSV
jgi:hypothetical protein